jgi:hypothetical protein
VFSRRQAIFDELNTAATAEHEPALENMSASGRRERTKRLSANNKAARTDNKTTEGDHKATAVDNTKKGKGQKRANAAAEAKAKAVSQIAEMGVMHLKEVVDEAVASGLSWEGIKGRMRLVLGGCRQLRGTEYEATINSFIERNCRASFALVLGEEDLKALWEDEQEQTSNGKQEKQEKLHRHETE